MTKEYLKMADVTFNEPVTESTGCIFGRVISERIKNGAYDMDDISAEVSQAIERLNKDAS